MISKDKNKFLLLFDPYLKHQDLIDHKYQVDQKVKEYLRMHILKRLDYKIEQIQIQEVQKNI